MPQSHGFPDRELVFAPQLKKTSPFWVGAGVVFMLALAAGVFALWGGDLVIDTMIGSDYRPDALGLIGYDGTCRSKLIITYCDIELWEAGRASRDISVLFLRLGSVETIDVAPGVSENGTLVLGIGQAALMERWITLGAIVLIFLAIAWFSLGEMRRARDVRRLLAAEGPQEIAPLDVVVQRAEAAKGSVTFTYRPQSGGPKVSLAYREGFEPLMSGIAVDRGGRTGRPLALAVRGEASDLPVLVSADLAELDLTAEERAAVFAALGAR